MLAVDGVGHSRYGRLTWDGGGSARAVYVLSQTPNTGKYFSTANRHEDEVFTNLAPDGVAVRAGDSGIGDAETEWIRCHFLGPMIGRHSAQELQRRRLLGVGLGVPERQLRRHQHRRQRREAVPAGSPSTGRTFSTLRLPTWRSAIPGSSAHDGTTRAGQASTCSAIPIGNAASPGPPRVKQSSIRCAPATASAALDLSACWARASRTRAATDVCR